METCGLQHIYKGNTHSNAKVIIHLLVNNNNAESVCNSFSSMACNLFEYLQGTFEKSYINPLILDEKIRRSPKANKNVFMISEDIK